jgi:hAT family C-terminal dimerisation region
MNYLPIQASSVPCERVFSSAAETDTKKRNRITPALMEALQMLKFLLKKQRLDFMGGWMTGESELLEESRQEQEPELGSLLGGDIKNARDELLGDDMNSE